MTIEQRMGAGEHTPRLTASITPAPNGHWVARIDLGAGASVSRVFPDEEQARRYPEELEAWLSQRRDSE
jgi:hypothetical protein